MIKRRDAIAQCSSGLPPKNMSEGYGSTEVLFEGKRTDRGKRLTRFLRMELTGMAVRATGQCVILKSKRRRESQRLGACRSCSNERQPNSRK